MAKVNYIPQNWFDTNVPDTQSGYIIPGKLHPAYLGKLLDGSTSHSGSYGSIQSDGRKYYYTDIDGSRPIKDPRIGAHFGSQRHLLKSLQLLEQETDTHGCNVYSVDGRDWLRCCASDKDFYTGNSANGNGIFSYGSNSSSFFEIVGYFNGINFSGFTHTTRGAEFSVNGGSVSTSNFFTTSTMTPLRDRYVPAGSSVNLTNSLTLGINTIKIIPEGADTGFWFNVELIAQDTTSTATRSQIQIPEQDVFTHGKKIRIPSHAEHYDPFNGFTSGSDISSYVDTTTSLGLSKWIHSGNYYRPYNGMRVVKWAGRTGIHTSVTVMPPNAKSIGNSSSLTNATAKANASVANDNFRPTFEAHTTSVNEDRLHELAKTFHFREFGNGAANGGTGATYADASMLSGTADAIGYVMDDGLTSMTGTNVRIQNLSTFGGVRIDSNNNFIYFTFIGTGIKTIRQRDNSETEEHITWAQNLHYGTHVLELQRDGSADQVVRIDGVTIETNSTTDKYLIFGSPTFFQPKMPPIPDDACIIADYMLMADFVPQTGTGHIKEISKGVRSVSASRDFFIDDTGSNSLALDLSAIHKSGFKISSGAVADSDTTITFRLPSFGTNYVSRGYQHDTRKKLFLDTTDKDSASTKDNTADEGSYAYLTSNLDLGVYKFGTNVVSGQYSIFEGFDVVTPIHTSHHYKTFETPFLHELIGGDRNMEQTHLVCSPDGKTWDDITRDKSYIRNISFLGTRGGGNVSATNPWFVDYIRGKFRLQDCVQKDIAVAYDRLIFLKSGLYAVDWQPFYNGAGWCYVSINTTSPSGIRVRSNYADFNISKRYYINVKKGDYLYISQTNGGSLSGDTSYFSQLAIEKV
tara:strand:- start:1756 stop:4332 length:2577 start_codon:yes stop_codon:yes gene_type:complete